MQFCFKVKFKLIYIQIKEWRGPKRYYVFDPAAKMLQFIRSPYIGNKLWGKPTLRLKYG